MTVAIVSFIVILVVCVAMIARSVKYGTGDARIQFRDRETGNVVRSGHGTSIGSAMADGFYKLSESLTCNSREDTIRSRLDVMTRTLAENRSRMHERDIVECEKYIQKVQKLKTAKDEEKKRKEQARRSIEQEKDKTRPASQRFVAQQRRLMSDSLRYDVLRRDGFRCQLCGATAKDGVKLHVDHIKPVSRGGKTEMSNLRTLCERCNLGKGAKQE